MTDAKSLRDNQIPAIAQTVILVAYVVAVLVVPDWIATNMCQRLASFGDLGALCHLRSSSVESKLTNMIYSLTFCGGIWGLLNYMFLEEMGYRVLKLAFPFAFFIVALCAGLPTSLHSAILLLTFQLAMFLIADLAVLKGRVDGWSTSDFDYDKIKRGLRTLLLSTCPSLVASVVILFLANRIFGNSSDAAAVDCAKGLEKVLQSNLPRLAMTQTIAGAVEEQCRSTSLLVGSGYLVGSLTALLVTANASFVVIWWLPRQLSHRIHNRAKWLGPILVMVCVLTVFIGWLLINGPSSR